MADTREVSFWEARAAAGEPVAAVRIKNLQSSIVGPVDAWGRTGKQQPVLVSVDIHFRNAFDSSSAHDQLNADTVHYGQLSKAILEVIVPITHQKDAQGSYIEEDRSSLKFHSGLLWRRLTGIHPLTPSDQDAGPSQPVLINIDKLAYMCITLRLPKASLLGEAITFSEALCFKNDLFPQYPAILYNSCLRIHRLRVPTLVGVNSNERQTKQVVVADVAIDGVIGTSDFYPVLESLTAKALDESALETLEALAAHLARTIAAAIIAGDIAIEPKCQIRISLEKPTAVTYAEAPVVELLWQISDG